MSTQKTTQLVVLGLVKLVFTIFNLTKNLKNCIIFAISLDGVLSATHPALHPVQTPQKVFLRDYERFPRLTDQINMFGGA